MSRRKRPWGVIAGPIIFFGGLVVFLGVQKAEGIKDMVQDWGYQLEHSSQPVVMELPVYVPLFVGGDWLGQLETVVVHRDRPGRVDNLRLVAKISDQRGLASLEGCALRLQIHNGSVSEFKRALRCVEDTAGLIPFGNLSVPNANLNVPVFVRFDDLPCNESRVHLGPCEEFHRDLQVGMRGLAEDLRDSAREFRNQARRVRSTVRAELKAKGIR
jgi:hypothetical protein